MKNCTIGYTQAFCRKLVSVDVVAPINDSAIITLDTHSVFPLLKGIKTVGRTMLVRGGAAIFDLKAGIKRRHLERPCDVIHIHSGSYLYGLTVASRALQGVAKVHSIYCPILGEG